MNTYDSLENKLSGALETLESIFSEKLNNFGIYYRMFARVKTGQSIEQKLKTERYRNAPDRKIRDLFGIRITLYYQDDIEICKRIFENIFINIRWKESESDTSTFDATKNNGTFLLPGFVQQIVQPEIEGLRIEPTFELQIRTVFFEGWHEAEHDMRYKEMELWKNLNKEARKLNSVLATLEMCDQYMVTLFDDVGHDFYKNENWAQMIRFRYRLRTLNGELDPDIEKLITPDLAKRIFKWNKKDFIDNVLESGINRLDADTIVYLVNESLKDRPEYVPELPNAYQNVKRKNARSVEYTTEKDMVLLKNEKAFGVDVILDAKQDEVKERFEAVLSVMFDGWIKKNLLDVFPEEFEGGIHPIKVRKQGVSCRFFYDREELKSKAVLSYIGKDAPGKTWTISISVFPDDAGNLHFSCRNEFARPSQAATEVQPYNRPKVYLEVAKQIGVWDVRKLESDIINVDSVGEGVFYSLLENTDRTLPVILITVPSENDCHDPEGCYGRLVDYTNNPKFPEQNNLMRKVGYVCHVFYATGETADRIAEKLNERPDDFKNGMRFFAAGFQFENKKLYYRSFNEKQIWEMPKDIYALRTKEPYFYQSVTGPDAVRHEIIQMVNQHILTH